MDHKVLIIVYSYPPTNSIGVRRPEKFAKYLPFFGYKPVVITSQDSGITYSDDDVYRFRDLGFDIQKEGKILSYVFRGIRKILFKLGILWGQNYLWYLKVLHHMDVIIEKNQPAIIWASYPPVEGLMIGVKIANKFDIPLVVDFRDGMVFEHTKNEPFLVKWRNRMTERYIINNSRCVISVTDALTEHFEHTYPKTRALTISNGFDLDDWENDQKLDLSNRVNIVHTGRLTGSSFDRTISPLLKAIDRLNEDDKSQIRIHMVGQLEDKEIRVLSQPEYKDIFNIVGLVNWEESLKYQMSSDVLLLVTGAGKRSVATGKLFEYMAAHKPIFALAHGNAAEEIIKKTGIGLCVNPENVSEIANSLKQIIKMSPQFEFYSPDKTEIEKYDRRMLAKELATVFNNIVEN